MAVYFITARDIDRVKIGYATNPVARFRHLQTSSPIDLALEGAIPGGFARERELHQRYASWRVKGEWFTITPSIEDEIAEATRPKEYTWAAVRLWVKRLDDEHETYMRDHLTPEQRAACEAMERRIRDEMSERRRISEMPILKRLEASGDIHFPFRETAEVDC